MVADHIAHHYHNRHIAGINGEPDLTLLYNGILGASSVTNQTGQCPFLSFPLTNRPTICLSVHLSIHLHSISRSPTRYHQTLDQIHANSRPHIHTRNNNNVFAHDLTTNPPPHDNHDMHERVDTPRRRPNRPPSNFDPTLRCTFCSLPFFLPFFLYD
jgi:hypothetical protein